MMKQLALLIFIALCGLVSYAQVTRIEAEDFTLDGTASKVSDNGSSAGMYVDLQGGNMSLDINIDKEAYFDVTITVAYPNGKKYNDFVIDGQSASFGSPETVDQYQTQKVASFTKLTAGTHTIEIKNSWGYVNIDYIELEEVDPSTRFDITQTLCTPNSTEETLKLYQFLLDNYGKKIISGAMTLNSMDMSDKLLAQTGKEPALLGLDFMQCDQDYSWYDDNTIRNDAETWYNRNGIPAICWHWRDPSTKGGEFYYQNQNHPDGTTFDATHVFDKTAPEYQAMIDDIDYVAGEFKYLQEKGVPVIWRPLHEASGGWFWWGAQGPAACKELWILMYDRLVNHHNIRNLIWVWTHQAGESADWYPGDEYVDIIGMDIYKTGDHTSQIMEFNNTNDIYGGKKLIAETECGSFPDPDKLIEDQAPWSWFMPWYDSPNYEFLTGEEYNPASFWAKVVDHDYVLMLDEMPDLRNYVSPSQDNADLATITSSEGALSPIFSADVKEYSVLVADGSAVPQISAAPATGSAKVTIEQATALGGSATITVVSGDESVTNVYTVQIKTYSPVAETIKLSQTELSMMTNSTETVSAIILDQYGVEMDIEINWSANGGVTFAPSTGSEVDVNSGSSAGSFTVTVEAGTLSETISVELIDGYQTPIPQASDWIVFNQWNDQTNGTGLANTDDALEVTHRAWGYGNLWMVNNGQDIPLEDGRDYNIVIDFQDGADASVAEVTVGFATSWDNHTVTAEGATNQVISSGFTNDAFTTHTSTVTANTTGNANLFIMLSWGADPESNKPSAEYTGLIKNIKIVPQSSATDPDVQTISLVKGWNLVSFNVEAADMSVESVFNGIDFSVIKTFDSFYKSGNPDFLQTLKQVETGVGYLINVETATALTVEGTAVETSTYSTELQTGWNLIGVPSTVAIDAAKITAIDGFEVIKDFDGYNDGAGLSTLDELKPNKAYYIKVSKPITINW